MAKRKLVKGRITPDPPTKKRDMSKYLDIMATEKGAENEPDEEEGEDSEETNDSFINNEEEEVENEPIVPNPYLHPLDKEEVAEATTQKDVEHQQEEGVEEEEEVKDKVEEDQVVVEEEDVKEDSVQEIAPIPKLKPDDFVKLTDDTNNLPSWPIKGSEHERPKEIITPSKDIQAEAKTKEIEKSKLERENERLEREYEEKLNKMREAESNIFLTKDELDKCALVAEHKNIPFVTVRGVILNKKKEMFSSHIAKFTFEMRKQRQYLPGSELLVAKATLSLLKTDKRFNQNERVLRLETFKNGKVISSFVHGTMDFLLEFASPKFARQNDGMFSYVVHECFDGSSETKLFLDIEWYIGKCKRKLTPEEFLKILEIIKEVSLNLCRKIVNYPEAQIDWVVGMPKDFETDDKFSCHLIGANVIFSNIYILKCFILRVLYNIILSDRYASMRWVFLSQAEGNKIIDLAPYGSHKFLRLMYFVKFNEDGTQKRLLMRRSDKDGSFQDFEQTSFRKSVVQFTGSYGKSDIPVITRYCPLDDNINETIKLIEEVCESRNETCVIYSDADLRKLSSNNGSIGQKFVAGTITSDKSALFKELLDDLIRQNFTVLSKVPDRPMVKSVNNKIEGYAAKHGVTYSIYLSSNYCPRRGDDQQHAHASSIVFKIYISNHRPDNPYFSFYCFGNTCKTMTVGLTRVVCGYERILEEFKRIALGK
jgi:hypothetical protein